MRREWKSNSRTILPRVPGKAGWSPAHGTVASPPPRTRKSLRVNDLWECAPPLLPVCDLEVCTVRFMWAPRQLCHRERSEAISSGIHARLLRRFAPRNDVFLLCHRERSEAISSGRKTSSRAERSDLIGNACEIASSAHTRLLAMTFSYYVIASGAKRSRRVLVRDCFVAALLAMTF